MTKVKALTTTLILAGMLAASAPACAIEFLPEWKKEISLGFDQSSGNTENTEFTGSASVSREFEAARASSDFNIYYGESNDVMDTQKWDSTTKYSNDFGENNEWFNIYKVTVDHDRFANIDYRILPSVGVGYWLSKTEEFEWSADVSLGYEITRYRSGTEDTEELTAILHTFVKKQIFDNAFISEDLSIIPSIEEDGIRIKSETKFVNPLQENLNLETKFIVDHDTEPAAGKKKTDTRLVIGVSYAF